jgi:hypothetical protein
MGAKLVKNTVMKVKRKLHAGWHQAASTQPRPPRGPTVYRPVMRGCVNLVTEGDPSDLAWSQPRGQNEFILELANVARPTESQA